MQLRAATLKLMLWFGFRVHSNGRRWGSPTASSLSRRSCLRLLHTLNTETQDMNRILRFNRYLENRLTRTFSKNIYQSVAFTRRALLLYTRIVTSGHSNIQAIVKRVLGVFLQTPQENFPIHVGILKVNKLAFNQVRICPKKPIKQRGWCFHNNQISASKWERSHSAKVTVSVMQYNMVNRARGDLMFDAFRKTLGNDTMGNVCTVAFKSQNAPPPFKRIFLAHKHFHFPIMWSFSSLTKKPLDAAHLASQKTTTASTGSPRTKLIRTFQMGCSAQSNWLSL